MDIFSHPPPYDISTDELRVVTRVLPPGNVFDEFLGGGEAVRTVVVKVQRKWLVFPDSVSFAFNYSSLAKPEWRDLPSVTEVEAEAERLTPPSQPA
jgi:hypothetical protein